MENCQTVVFAAYVTGRAHVPSDFQLYLPRTWCVGQARREKAYVPEEAAFTVSSRAASAGWCRRGGERPAAADGHV